MRAELRPSSLGEILDRTAQMYRSHFLLYFGIAAISYAGILVLSLLVDVLFYSHTQASARGFAALSVVLGIGIALLTILPVAIAMELTVPNRWSRGTSSSSTRSTVAANMGVGCC